MKVLIIEDDSICQQVYSDTLSGAGHSVVCVEDGETALLQLKQTTVELIVLDLGLPGISGRALLAEIKKIDRTIPIIIVSGRSGMEDDPEIKMYDQVQIFVPKPVIPKDLITIVSGVSKKVSKKEPNREYIGKNEIGGKIYRVTKEREAKIIVFSPDLANNKQVLSFVEECKKLTKVRNDNILQCFAVQQTEAGIEIEIEDFSGDNLETILQRQKKFAISRAVNIICHIADGMQEAHNQGIIHGDLRPQNCLYNSKNKSIKVTNFGLSLEISSLTPGKTTKGAPLYMSPEQCLGKDIDHRSDIYNLGVTFYQLLTGSLPFVDTTVTRTMLSQVREELEWPENFFVPLSLQKVISKMLVKNRAKRYHRIQEVSDALSNAFQHMGVQI